MSTFVYIKNFVKDRDIASITPTSSYGVRKVCSRIDFSKDQVIVEYGPATGVFTRYLLDRMTPRSKLVLIERNAEFVSILRRSFADDRLRIYRDSAECVKQIVADACPEGANYILSGIPFSFFEDDVRRRIVEETYAVLQPGGKFLPYQTFFQQDRHLLDHLSAVFPNVRHRYCLRNLPPMRIYEATKGS
ncbi:class I SAM-dependent methyltransferase [Paenibacillus sp.]|uniref:class I SAM-dependent methyltransferase n=1 Tax=Paenibacillus sp. TaxID=58172 RepID=UPI002D542484|nr:methyltransferase domain-containing protein [Paenibacillus sp.]HZG57383.1 methyltransferase domain-containing protein [Paenibacillus sp.]